MGHVALPPPQGPSAPGMMPVDWIPYGIWRSYNPDRVQELIVPIVAAADPLWQARPQWPFTGHLHREVPKQKPLMITILQSQS